MKNARNMTIFAMLFCISLSAPTQRQHFSPSKALPTEAPVQPIMDLTVSGNTVTLTIDNTSPTTLDNNTGVNVPAILAFGFDLANDPLPAVIDCPCRLFSMTATLPPRFLSIRVQAGNGGS